MKAPPRKLPPARVDPYSRHVGFGEWGWNYRRGSRDGGAHYGRARAIAYFMAGMHHLLPDMSEELEYQLRRRAARLYDRMEDHYG